QVDLGPYGARLRVERRRQPGDMAGEFPVGHHAAQGRNVQGHQIALPILVRVLFGGIDQRHVALGNVQQNPDHVGARHRQRGTDGSLTVAPRSTQRLVTTPANGAVNVAKLSWTFRRWTSASATLIRLSATFSSAWAASHLASLV